MIDNSSNLSLLRRSVSPVDGADVVLERGSGRDFATALVEPNILLREGITQILEAANFAIVYSNGSIENSIFDILSQHQSVLLVTGTGQDAKAAITQIELFKSRQPAARVAVLAASYCQEAMVLSLRAGANAYISNVKSCDALIKSLELVMLGETILPSEILSFFLSKGEETIDRGVRANLESTENAGLNPSFPHFSAQEKRVLQFLVDGDCNKVIARKIQAAEATVKVHVKAILRKLRVNNRTQAVVWAMTNGHVQAVDGYSRVSTTPSSS